MKNIHLQPTSQLSRLVKIYNEVDKKLFELKLDIEVNDNFKEYQNIYITSDEEIKDRNCWVTNGVEIFKPSDLPEYSLEYANRYWEKIILTTDDQLIADGVHAIDDTFLEWFVKNPSCEFVEIELDYTKSVMNYSYKIIIPQEEPKQEPLEEVAEKVLANNIDGLRDALQDDDLFLFYKGVIQCYGEAMANYQAKRMYSEEEMLDILDKFLTSMVKGEKTGLIEDWFKQFKKK